MWDKFKAAEDRIDSEAIESEVDAAMRGEVDGMEFDQKLAAASRQAELTSGVPAGPDDALAMLKTKMEDAKKQKALAAATPDKAEPEKK